MSFTEVVLESGEKIQVRGLGLFEVDVRVPLPEKVTEPFTYQMETIGGEIYHVQYDMTSPEPPKPSTPKEECPP